MNLHGLFSLQGNNCYPNKVEHAQVYAVGVKCKAPVPLKLFRSDFKIDENSFDYMFSRICSSYIYNTIFCTNYFDVCKILLLSYQSPLSYNDANFQRIRDSFDLLLVRQVPGYIIEV